MDFRNTWFNLHVTHACAVHVPMLTEINKVLVKVTCYYANCDALIL